MSTTKNKQSQYAYEEARAELEKGYNSALKKLNKSFGRKITANGTKVISTTGKKSYPQNRVRTSTQTINHQGSNSLHKPTKAFLPYHLFKEALVDYGRPGTTREVGNHLKRISKEARKEFKLWGDEAYMQLMYNSSSYLVERGEIRRSALGGRKFQYYLKEWDKNAKKHKQPAISTGNRTKENGLPTQVKRKYTKRKITVSLGKRARA